MIATIVGWFWTITGIIFLIKPGFLKRRLQKKSLKRLRRLLFSIALFLGFILIVAAWKQPGILSKVLMILGIISIAKGFFLLKAKVADKILEWFAKQSLVFYRLCACCHILIGATILLLRK